jgi:hypothetical protein
MEIHLGLLPYPKENDTSEEVSLGVISLSTIFQLYRGGQF